MSWMARLLSGSLLIFLGVARVATAQAAGTLPACAVDYIASDHGLVIPSKVTGAPGSRLTLYRIHPDNLKVDDPQSDDIKADAAYLLTGDKVEQVETCDGYAYVRFDGPRRISTGWVESDRLAPQGEPYRLAPVSTQALCRAAAEIMNHDGRFPVIPQRSIDKAFASKNGYLGDENMAQSVTRLKLGDRVFTAVDVNDGGSCSSTYQEIWSGDLSRKLSPRTRPHDDPAFNLAQGRDETWVEILGKPVLLGNGSGSDVFYISTLDDDGQIHTTCKGSLQPLAQKRLLSSRDDKVCVATERGKETPDSMGEPTGDGSVTLSSPRKGLKRIGKSDDDGFTDENEGPGVMTYKVIHSGSVDINSDGKPVRLAIVSYEFSSGAGCGSGVHLEAPVLIDENDHVDPTEPVNDAIFKRIGGPSYGQDSFTRGSMKAQWVTVAGGHYLETTWTSGEQEIWSVSGGKAVKQCSLQTLHYVVTPNGDVGTVH